MKKIDFTKFNKDLEEFIFSNVGMMNKLENKYDDEALSTLGKELHEKIKERYNHNLDYLFVNVKAVIRDIMFYPNYAFSNIDAISRNIYFGVRHKASKEQLVIDFSDVETGLNDVKALNYLYDLKMDVEKLVSCESAEFEKVKMMIDKENKQIIIVLK